MAGWLGGVWINERRIGNVAPQALAQSAARDAGALPMLRQPGLRRIAAQGPAAADSGIDRHEGVGPFSAQGYAVGAVLILRHEGVGPVTAAGNGPEKDPSDFKPERDAAILRSIMTLESINGKPAAEFWKQLDAQPNKP